MNGSWIITRRATGEVIGEFFDARSVAQFDPEKCLIETAQEYLKRLNAGLSAKSDALRHYTPAEQRRGLDRLAADVEGNGWDHVDTSHD
jgi:hypothetical protein